jgi:phosphotransferase system HPr (HPr) family protein
MAQKYRRFFQVVCEKLRIENEKGLHLRPAGELVGRATKFHAHVMIIYGENRLNCKSLMSLLAFPVCPGAEVTVECFGEDEEEALTHIVAFLKSLK